MMYGIIVRIAEAKPMAKPMAKQLIMLPGLFNASARSRSLRLSNPLAAIDFSRTVEI